MASWLSGFLYCSMNGELPAVIEQCYPSQSNVSIHSFRRDTKEIPVHAYNTWISARYLPALVALPRSGDSLSRKPKKFTIYKFSKQAQTRQRSAPRRWDFIKSPGQQILLISAFQVTSRLTAPAASAIEKICPRVLFRLMCCIHRISI